MTWYEVTFQWKALGGEPKTDTQKIEDMPIEEAKSRARKIIGAKWGIIKSFRRIEEIQL